jgi:amidohydrolase
MDRKTTAEEAFGAVESELADINQWMYDNPEVGFEEFETSARLVAFLAEHGFEVEYPAYGLDTAFVARVGTQGPEVIICAEMDALPTVGHACGHNIIATSALGAGAALADSVEDLGIRVTVLGTPAEEQMGGKVDLINAGAFARAAASMMVHPSNSDVVDPAVLAVRHIDVEFFGKDSHAAFAPQLGINALDAFVQAYVNTSTLRQALYPTDKIHSIITQGGDAPNIIPSYTRSSWYVRAGTRERLEELYERVLECFDAAATATGCTWKVENVGHPFEDLVNNRVMVELFAANSEHLGRPMGRGADEEPGAAGSTDMGNVSHVVPSIHPFLSIDPGEAVNHQPEFAAHTVTPDGRQAIKDGALAMAWTIIDLAERNLWADLKAT